MKIFMLTGAMTGFAIGIALGFAGSAGWPSTLWHACVGAAALGLLMRWWGRTWTRGLRDALEQRHTRGPVTVPQSAPNTLKKS
jgi:hypothetical protein